MRKISKTALLAAAAAATTGVFSLPAHAQTQTWNVTEAIGSFNWNEDVNWTPGPWPNGAGIIANVNNDITTPMEIRIPGGDGATVGVLNLGDASTPPPPGDPNPNPDQKFTIGTLGGGAGTFIFDNGANDAQLNATKQIDPAGNTLTQFDQLGTNLTLNSNLVITANGPTTGSIVQIRGKISDGINGPKGIIMNGPNNVELRSGGEDNTYTGLTVVNGGRFRLMSGSSATLIAGDIEINANATVQDGFGNGNCIADTSMITLNAGFYNPGGGSDTIGGLQGPSGEAGGGAGTISFGANNLDAVFNGRFTSSTSWTKVGTGVQTLGGSANNVQSSGTRNFRVHGGRVDLNKDAGFTAIAQTNVFIGDGTQAGETRPEVRLLQSQQIGVTAASSGAAAETTVMTLNSGILNLNGNSETVGTMAVSGTGISAITVGGAGKLNVVNGLTVNDGATLEVTPGATLGGNGAIDTGPTLIIGASGKLDLKDNKLVTAGPVGSWDGTKYTGLQGEVGRAYDFGAWDLPGIYTSMPDAGPTVGKATIGVATGEQALFLAPTETGVFGGQTINGTTAIAMYTWAGDVDLNGYVDAVDYGTIDQWIQFPGTTGYTNGDLNYDGVIDAVDYGIIDNGIQLQGAPIPINPASSAAAAGVSGVTAVPEPASLSVIGLAAASLLARRRRRCSR